MVDYRQRLGFWESVAITAPTRVFLWALAKGYGPLMLFWGLGLAVVFFGLRFLVRLGRLFLS
jgi:hypothetical protein